MKAKIKQAPLITARIILIISLIVQSTANSQDQQVQESQKNEAEKISEKALQQFSLLSTLTQIKNETYASQCQKELKLIIKGFLAREAWAMKVVDATGTKPAGFLFGQNLWLGSRDTCTAAQHVVSIPLSLDRFERIMDFGILNETAPFDVSFKVAYLDFKTRWQVDWQFVPPEKTIVWGFCLPASCSNTEIAELMRLYIKSEEFPERKVFDIQPTLDHVKTLKFSFDFFKFRSVKILLAILCFTFIMIVAAMYLRFTSTKSKIKRDREAEGLEKNDDIKSNAQELNIILAFIKCFDVAENMKKIFRINKSESEINTISTIRTSVANLIIILHVVWFGIIACASRITFVIFFIKPAVCYVYVIVEAFFVISGFLLAYNFLRNQKKRLLIKDAKAKELPMLFLKLFVQRWLRLAPPYYMILCLNTVLHALLNQLSVYKLSTQDDLLMAEYWPRYLLFMQNIFFDLRSFSVNWSWSTACEMQFFLIGMALLFIYVRRPSLAKAFYSILIVGVVIAYIYNGWKSKFSWNYDAALDASLGMYLHPEVRIISYLIGLLAAWYIVEKPFVLPPKVESWLRGLSIVLFGLLISPLTDSLNSTSISSALVLLLMRSLLSFWLCWLIIAEVTKRRFWLSSILETKVFQPTARLSYGIYLLNPIITKTVIGFTNMGFLFDYSLLVMLMAGTILLTKWVSVIFTVAFELPYSNLSTLLFRPKTLKLHSG